MTVHDPRVFGRAFADFKIKTKRSYPTMNDKDNIEIGIIRANVKHSIQHPLSGKMVSPTDVRLEFADGGVAYEGDLEKALETYRIWQWQYGSWGTGWMELHKQEDSEFEPDLPGIALDEASDIITPGPTYSLAFTRLDMFQQAVKAYLDDYDVRNSAPLVKFTLMGGEVVTMVLREASEVDNDHTMFIGRPEEDSTYGPKIYVFSKAVIAVEISE